jgi:hypothetical protein
LKKLVIIQGAFVRISNVVKTGRSSDRGFFHVLSLRKYWFVWLVMLANSQIFVAASNNPFSIKGLGEISYAMFSLFAFYYLVLNVKNLKKIDMLVIAIPVVLIVYSAVMAKFTFGQPLYAGFIEARRALSLYVYFPLAYLIRSGRIDTDGLLDVVIWLGIFSLLLGVMFQLGWISPFVELDRGQLSIRQDRITAGNHFIAIAFMVAVASLSFGAYSKFLMNCIWISMLFALFFISQTRGVLIAAVFSVIFVSNNLRSFAKKYALIFSILIVSPIVIFPLLSLSERGEGMVILFSELLDGQNLSGSVRAQSIGKVLENLTFWGSGALWGNWNNGFESIFGEYFFLSDIGIFGTVYVYGIGSVFLLMLMVFWLFKVATLPSQDRSSMVAKFLFVYLIIMLPTAAIFEYRGFLLGIALVLLVLSFGERSGGKSGSL